jgi:hypothetical protein
MASSRPIPSQRADRLPARRPVASGLMLRTALGLAVTLGGVVWIALALSSISWFGPTPIGLYRSLDQPPILLCLVGIWYTARGLAGRDDEEPDERGGEP